MFKKMIGKMKEGAFAATLMLLAAIAGFFMVTRCMADTGTIETQSIASISAVDQLMRQVVFPIISGLALSLLSLVLHRLQQKYKLDILTSNQELIEKAALQGISLAEEKAAQSIKGAIIGNTKLRYAVEHMQSVIPTITTDQARNVIEGMLARIPGVGATKGKVVTLDSSAAAVSVAR